MMIITVLYEKVSVVDVEGKYVGQEVGTYVSPITLSHFQTTGHKPQIWWRETECPTHWNLCSEVKELEVIWTVVYPC